MISWLLQNLSSLYLKESVVWAEITDNKQVTQINQTTLTRGSAVAALLQTLWSPTHWDGCVRTARDHWPGHIIQIYNTACTIRNGHQQSLQRNKRQRTDGGFHPWEQQVLDNNNTPNRPFKGQQQSAELSQFSADPTTQTRFVLSVFLS